MARLRAAAKSTLVKSNGITCAPWRAAMEGVASVDPVSTTMHSPARSRTESRHRARLCSSFLTIRQRLRAAGMLRALPAAAGKEIKQAGSRHGGFGLNRRLVAGLLASQIHAG